MGEKQQTLVRAEMLNGIYEERPKLFGLAWSHLADEKAAEQVFQELVIFIENHQGRFSNLEGFRRWCWRAMRKRSLNLLARQSVLEESASAAADDELAERDTGEIKDWAEALGSCMDQLDPAARWMVQLRYFEGKSGLEVARLTGRHAISCYEDFRRIYTRLMTCVRRRIAMGRIVPGPSADREFQRLVFRYLEDQLTEEMEDELAIELQSRERVLEFNDIRLHSVLLHELGASAVPGESIPFFPPIRARSKLRKRVAICLSMLALFLVAGVGLLFKGIGEGPAQPIAPATFVQGIDAHFAGRDTPKDEESLSEGSYELKFGTIRMRFGGGAIVMVEGPAQFRIVSEDELAVKSGTVTALVPEQAIGFVIDTEVCRIRDLGTEFGVVAYGAGKTEVVVFQGRVEVEQAGLEKRELTSGEGLRLLEKGTRKNLDARSEGYRFPLIIPPSSPERDQGNLVINASFETGPLSRVPQSGRRYRDLPSRWSARQYSKGTWQSLPVSMRGTIAGASRSGGSHPIPSHGERYIIVERGQILQQVGSVQSGSTYKLTAALAAPLRKGDRASSTRSFQFGLWAGDTWIAEKTGRIPIGRKFKDFGISLKVAKKHRLHGEPLFVVLSGKAAMYFDNIRLERTVTR